MPGYNTQFELDVADLDLIETALQARKKDLSLKRLALASGDAAPAELARIDQVLSDTHDLLGRLHNQKIFYRPKSTDDAPYIGG
jgi:hypothetical protein